MKRLKLYILLLASASIISACRDEGTPTVDLNDRSEYSYNWEDIFVDFWHGMNDNYVFWSVDNTDWDAVYDEYRPLFAALEDGSDNAFFKNRSKAVTYFRELTSTLVDGHYALMFASYTGVSSMIFPASERVRRDRGEDYHSSISSAEFKASWDKHMTYEGVSGNELTLVYGKIDNNILYLYISDFRLTDIYYANDNQYKTLYYKFLNDIKQNNNIQGVIIDVRGNGGGSSTDMNILLGKMIDKPLHLGYLRQKQGTGRLDYSPWNKAILNPEEDGVNITAPIVAIADMHSVSMSEMVTMGIKAMPNGHFVGERTWGGQGPLTANSGHGGGQFSSAAIELTYTSSMMFKNVDGNIYEGIGFSPDVEVKYEKGAMASGRDPQLEKAIEIIKNNQ